MLLRTVHFVSQNGLEAYERANKLENNDMPAPKLTITEQLAYGTVRIECQLASGQTGTGTGFFFSFLREESGRHIPAIVTNKHVVRGAVRGQFHLTRRNADGGPIDNSHITVPLDNFEARWAMHPDANVDLCALPIAPILKAAASQNDEPFYVSADETLLPSDHDLSDLSAMEDVVMIGYPNGIWDSVNNQPVFRRGITATHPAKDFKGKSEFLIDAACFPGSSGSPVFLLNIGGYQSRKGVMIGPSRIKLLGVLYAGPQFTATGEIKVVQIPTVQQAISVTNIPNNLGFVIKSKKLLDFNAVFARALGPAV